MNANQNSRGRALYQYASEATIAAYLINNGETTHSALRKAFEAYWPKIAVDHLITRLTRYAEAALRAELRWSINDHSPETTRLKPLTFQKHAGLDIKQNLIKGAKQADSPYTSVRGRK